MRRAACFVTVCSLLLGCSPELGETPFACSSEAICPEGYSCQSSVCIKDGSSLPSSHAMRGTFINSGEMTWLARPGGGAELIVNDGFSPGARGIYAIGVAPDGVVETPRAILPYGGGVPMSSSAIELPDGRYGIVTINFPDIEGDEMTLTVRGIERDVAAGAAASIETLYTDKSELFLGGAEPAYVSAIAGDGMIDIAWTRPSAGGKVEVVRIAKQGALWKAVKQVTEPLPEGILPLSGDCLLWKTGPDTLLVRVGYEQFAVAAFDLSEGAMMPSTPFEPFEDIPIYGWGNELLLLRYGELDVASGSYPVSYALWDRAKGMDIAGSEDDGGVIQELIEPYTGLPSGDGALFGPLSSDPAFPVLEVASRSVSQGLARVASVTRTSSDPIYSARAFETGGAFYFAWTEFHQGQMDLWVAVATPSLGLSGALIRPPQPQRVGSFADVRVRGMETMGGPPGQAGLPPQTPRRLP